MDPEESWLVMIITGRCHCPYLVNGECGGRKTVKYECELMVNKSGKCTKKDCPILARRQIIEQVK